MSGRSQPTPDIHKFGGASLADAAAIGGALRLVREMRGTPVIVVSALAGVTDGLLGAISAATLGDGPSTRTLANTLRARYRRAATALLRKERREVLESVRESFDELDRLLVSIGSLKEANARTQDYVLARGERLAATLFAAGLRQAGRQARYIDALDVIRTNGPFGNATPNLKATDRSARKALLPLLRRGIIPVVPGFLGAGPDGELTTLGRGGADLTATLLARSLGSPEVTLWKDVAGILTADPRTVPGARVIPQLHLREAAELAYYGARVLHPRALIPLTGKRTAIRVRPFAKPAALGTEVSRRQGLAGFPVKALSAISGQALVTVAGNGMLGVPGIAARTFEAVHREGISVTFITQASSEHSISFAIPEASAHAARASLAREFRREIARREIDGVEIRGDVGILAVVGMGIAGKPGITARVFAALAEAGINVLATAHGSSDLNLSVVLDAADAPRAQRLVHAAFQLDKLGGGALSRRRGLDVVLLGFGQVGRALAPLIAAQSRTPVSARVVGVIDRSGFVFDPAGFSLARLRTLAGAKGGGASLVRVAGGHAGSATDAIQFLSTHALREPVLVDVTAGETGTVLEAALRAGFDLVLANKRPLAGSQRAFDRLRATAVEHGRRLLHEATVGAGLPIIDTFRKLVEAGDRVLRIEACPSGTLGFLFGELGRGRPFSAALRDAMDKGYTEPDPRDDLSGLDVARKALILGRLLGFRGELKGVAVESLVTPATRRLTTAEFLRHLERDDALWARRIAAAAARGRVLRYRAVATSRRVQVGLRLVDPSSPTASLNGTDNQFVFTTLRYRDNPLVITGPGAGPAVTAGGVLNDILRLGGA